MARFSLRATSSLTLGVVGWFLFHVIPTEIVASKTFEVIRLS